MGNYDTSLAANLLLSRTVKKILKSANISQSYERISYGTLFYGPRCYGPRCYALDLVIYAPDLVSYALHLVKYAIDSVIYALLHLIRFEGSRELTPARTLGRI